MSVYDELMNGAGNWSVHEEARVRLAIDMTEADDYEPDDQTAAARSQAAHLLSDQADELDKVVFNLRVAALEYLKGDR